MVKVKEEEEEGVMELCIDGGKDSALVQIEGTQWGIGSYTISGRTFYQIAKRTKSGSWGQPVYPGSFSSAAKIISEETHAIPIKNMLEQVIAEQAKLQVLLETLVEKAVAAIKA